MQTLKEGILKKRLLYRTTPFHCATAALPLIIILPYVTYFAFATVFLYLILWEFSSRSISPHIFFFILSQCIMGPVSTNYAQF